MCDYIYIENGSLSLDLISGVIDIIEVKESKTTGTERFADAHRRQS